MATSTSTTPRREGTWTKLVIFAALYCLSLESILELVLVLFLYANHQVDSKMTVSLILALVSVCSIDCFSFSRPNPITNHLPVSPFDSNDLVTELSGLAIQQNWRIWRAEDSVTQCLHLRLATGSHDVAGYKCIRPSGGCSASVLSALGDTGNLLEDRH